METYNVEVEQASPIAPNITSTEILVMIFVGFVGLWLIICMIMDIYDGTDPDCSRCKEALKCLSITLLGTVMATGGMYLLQTENFILGMIGSLLIVLGLPYGICSLFLFVFTPFGDMTNNLD